MIDHTADLAQLKINLFEETNKKSALWELLLTTGDELNSCKRTTLEVYGRHSKIKAQLKCCEDNIRTLKAAIKSENEF